MTEQSSPLFISFCEYHKINLFNSFNQPKEREANTVKEAIKTETPLAKNEETIDKTGIEINSDGNNATLLNEKKETFTPNASQEDGKNEDIIKEQNDNHNPITIEENKEEKEKKEEVIEEGTKEEDKKEIEKLVQKEIEIKEFKDADSSKDIELNQKSKKDSVNSLGNLGLGSIFATIGVVSGLGFYLYMKYRK